MATQPRKSTPPALELPPIVAPERPASKVEQGLAASGAGKTDEREAELTAAVAESTVRAGELREQAIEAVAEAVDYGQPLCPHGCHGGTWADVPAQYDGVGCEHGSYFRRPQE